MSCGDCFIEKYLPHDASREEIPAILERAYGKRCLNETIYGMVKNFENTDFVVKISDQKNTLINCHLLVLQSYSNYFATQIDTSSGETTLPAERVSVKAFMQIYEWMLADRSQLSVDNLLGVLMAANYLEINELQSQCWLHIDNEDKFNEHSAFLLYWKGRHLPLADIRDIMLGRIGLFFLSLVACKEFCDLNFDEVIILLKSNLVGVHTEAEIFFSAIRWMFHDWTNRQQHLLEIIECVRFGLMTPWQLTEFQRNCDSKHLYTVFNEPEIALMLKQGITVAISRVDNDPSVSTTYLEKLHLNLPSERTWISDAIWLDLFGETEQTSYKAFNQYLSILQTKELEHWRTLTIHRKPYILDASTLTAVTPMDSQQDIVEDFGNVSIGD